VVGKRKPKRKHTQTAVPVDILDAEHELVIERAAAIDVAKASGKVCVRLPGADGRRLSRVWDVPATTAAVTELGDQLLELRIEKITVESTSDYVRHEGA
jgi:transposase